MQIYRSLNSLLIVFTVVSSLLSSSKATAITQCDELFRTNPNASAIEANSYGDLILVVGAPDINHERLREAVVSKHPNVLGKRIPLRLPSAGAAEWPTIQAFGVDLGKHDDHALDEWSGKILKAAQAQYPNEKLEIRSVHLGVGFNAERSVVHFDSNQESYILGTMTFDGGLSTIAFSDSAMARIRAIMDQLKANNAEIDPYILDKDEDGSLKIVIRKRKSNIALAEITIPSEEYMQPPSNTALIFSGLLHVKSDPNVKPLGHASPLADHQPAQSRLTLFISIGPSLER